MGSALKIAKNALSSQLMLPAHIFHEPTVATDNVRDIKPSCDSRVQKFAYELGIWHPLHFGNLFMRTGRHPQRELVALVHGGSRGTAVGYRDVGKDRTRCNPAGTERLCTANH